MFLRSVAFRLNPAPLSELSSARTSTNDKIPDTTLASPNCKISFKTRLALRFKQLQRFFNRLSFLFFHLSLHLSDSFILSPFSFSSRAFFEIFYFRFRLSPSTGFFNFDSFNLESRLSSPGSSPATGKNIPEERKSARGFLQNFREKIPPRSKTAATRNRRGFLFRHFTTFTLPDKQTSRR